MKITILKLVNLFAGFAGLFLIALMILPFIGQSVNAQNKSVRAGARSKAAASKRAGKNGKIKNKNKEIDDDDEQEDKPKVVKLSPRTGNFSPGTPISKTARSFGITPALRDMPEVNKPESDFEGESVIRDDENNEVEVDRTVDGAGLGDKPFSDPLAAKSRSKFSILSPQAMPGPALSFNGILSADLLTTFGTTSMPPDTVGDVGPNNYVQATNYGVFRVFNKSGAPLTATANISTLFAGLPAGDLCRSRNDGDPVVNYDPLADRWLVSQFYSVAPFGQCIAVSKTGDPTGAWYAYDFPSPAGNFPDYPHWAVWTDGYYLSTHEFNAGLTAYLTAGFYAFNRNKMIVGDPSANYIYFTDASSFGQLPTDIDGYVPPAAGTSELFMEYDSALFGGTSTDSLLVHELVPDFTTPANSTFTLKTPVPVAAFDPRNPTGRADIEQPVVAASAYLDSISDRNMFRIAYRNLGTSNAPVNSYVTNWTVNVSGVNPTSAALHQAGVRWEELRRDGAGALSVFDQGTHAPDPVSGTGRNRWMGSIAQDNQGNLALGFSRSGSGASDFPDIVWAGRTGGQTAAGTLNEGEATMHASTGYQSSGNRWGDYSAMTVDPTDDCTFWYTQEWREAVNNGTGTNNQFKWSTRVGNFKFPTCTAAPKGQIAANVTNCATGDPVNGAAVLAQAGNFLRMTNASGNLISNIIAAPGNYILTGFRKGYTTSTSANVTVTDGGVTSGSICLGGGFTILELASTPAPTPVDENGNGRLDPGETATLNIPLINTGGLDATAVSATLTTTTPGVTILPPQTQSYPNLQKENGTGTNVGPYRFKLDSSFVCGSPIDFTLAVNYNGTTAAKTFSFTVATLSPFSVTTTLDTTAPPTAPEYTATTGTQTGRIARTGVASVCGTAKANPGLTVTTGARQYDAYIFTATSTGCITVTLDSTNGANIFSAAYNSAGFVPATPNTNYLADAGTSAASVTYSFNVTAGQKFTVVVHDVNVTPASGSNYTLGVTGPIDRNCQVYTPTLEGDVATRPNGDGAIASNDVVQVTRFVNELDTPSISPNEFQRTDSAPRTSSGDGAINSSDIVQTIRYLNELDATQSANGPTAPGSGKPSVVADSIVSGKSVKSSDSELSGKVSSPDVAPELRVESTSGSAGNQVSVNIRVDATGNEAQYAFAVLVDPNVLTYASFAAGGTTSQTFSCNGTATAGRVRCSIGAFTGNQAGSNTNTIGEIAPGNNQILIKVNFTVAANAQANSTTAVNLGSQSASDDSANSITPAITNGTVTIAGATAGGVTLGGRALTSNGRGIGDVSVTMTDAAGGTRTTRTTAFGYFQFNDVPTGQTYVIRAQAKRFTFTQNTQVRLINGDLSDIEFVADH